MKKLFVLATLSLVSAAYAADVAYSPPVGGITVTLAGAVSGVPKVSTFTPAMRLTLGANFVGKGRGTLTGVTATTLADSTAGWAAAGLSQPATPYFIRIRSGAAAGTWWQVASTTASTDTTVTVLNRGINPQAAGVAVGDQYEVVPGDTLQTLFSDIATSIGGPNASTADVVRLHDGVGWREYFFNTTVGQWRQGSLPTNNNNVAVRPDAGVVYIRRGAGNISFVMLGAVSDAQEKITIGATGVTPIGSVFPVGGRTLGSLNLQNTPGFVVRTGTLAAADKVSVFDGVGWRSFHYLQSANQWREGSLPTNRNTFELPFNAAIVIERGTGASGATFATLLPPYTL
ncbi:MAG: hypothetical protein NDI75_13770 [Candidatus Didemnitutus sp.]|nr:hypothetical protein [Candidatus Didemnitutus sp.]